MTTSRQNNNKNVLLITPLATQCFPMGIYTTPTFVYNRLFLKDAVLGLFPVSQYKILIINRSAMFETRGK